MSVAMIGPKFYAWDRNGKPLAFGKLYTYQARTNVPKPTYQSEDQVVDNTNPVILNGEGYADVYLDGSYKMVLKDGQDNEIWSSDPVTSASADEWINCFDAQYVSPSAFKIAGNQTDNYRPGRKVRVDNNTSTYAFSTILTSSYDGTDTSVSLTDDIVTTGIQGVCTSIVSPDSSFNAEDILTYTKYVFSTVSDAVSVPNSIAVTLKEGDKVETRKYNADIVQQWLVSATEPVGEYSVAIGGSGLYLVEVSNEKYFESFGAYANGSDLDDSAFEFARSYDGKVYGLGDYLIEQLHPLTNKAKWYGRWSKISAQGTNQLFTFSSDIRFGEFELDGLDGAHTAYPTQILSPSENVELGDIIYRNFHGVIATFQTYPLNIPMYGASNFKVGNLEFYNITQNDDGVILGPGFVGGVYLVGLDAEVLNGKSYGVVGNVFGDTIKSVDSGSGVVQDSDLIRIFAETASTEEFDITFGDVTGRNVYKRIIKASSCGGITFGDVKSFNPEDGVENYTLFACVEVLGTGFNFKFGDVITLGASERTVWFRGSGNQCGDIFSSDTDFSVLFGGGGGDLAQSCQCGNVIGRGIDGSEAGTGVYFFNANSCQVGDVTGLFAVSLLSFEDNTGRNSVGNITCAGRVSALNGITHVTSIVTDIQATVVAGSHFSFGEGFSIGYADIVTDGRVTMSVVGANCDVDLGKTNITRVSAINGVESNHSVFTSASATSGLLKGSLNLLVGNTVAGTPSGSSGRTLAYFTGLNVENFDLSIEVTASVRGATGFHYWFNGVDGQINRAAVKSLLDIVGSQASGKLGITKAEYLVPGSPTLTLSGEVNLFLAEKDSTATITGAANTPVVVNSTR